MMILSFRILIITEILPEIDFSLLLLVFIRLSQKFGIFKILSSLNPLQVFIKIFLWKFVHCLGFLVKLNILAKFLLFWNIRIDKYSLCNYLESWNCVLWLCISNFISKISWRFSHIRLWNFNMCRFELWI